MFQRLDQLRSGSLFIITGLPGAGKSHLAASARKEGTVWVIDTEGAAHNLRDKPGIHSDIRAVQTLSLRQLIDAMREIKRQGKPGDTVILDSVSKVIQAMRSYAQQRAGGDTDRKTSLSYDEHASVNRNMQSIYTGLTELKHAGFHVILIGHLAKKYETHGSALKDTGLRILADSTIEYEADAVLLVERNNARRSTTPIIKPPRQRHLQLNHEYPATLATLYPDLAVTDAPDRTGAEPENVSTFPASANVARTPRDAERRFFERFGDAIGGDTWDAVEAYLGYESDKPTTVDEWRQVALEVRGRLDDAEAA